LPPKYSERCLTLDAEGLPPDIAAGLIAVSGPVRREMALLQGEAGVLLVRVQNLSAAGLHALRDLRTRAEARGSPVAGECVAVSGLMPLLYQHFADFGKAAALSAREEATPTTSDSEAQQAFEDLVFQAGESGASDIHVIIRRDRAEIQFRIHGEIEDTAHWTVQQAESMCACAYTVLAKIRDVTWVPDRPQDANFAHTIRGRLHRIRYSHKPIYPQGVHVVMRILSTGKGFTFGVNDHACASPDGLRDGTYPLASVWHFSNQNQPGTIAKRM
jgi:hypothetical protein